MTKALEHLRYLICILNFLGLQIALMQSAEKEFKIALDLSNKNSAEAAENLRFCKFHKQNSNQNLMAKLQFSERKNYLQTGNNL